MRSRLVLVWIYFVAGGVFYASFAPLWEAFDEWAYFAVIDHISRSGEPIVDRDLRVSEEVNQSLDLAPLPRGMTRMPSRGIQREAYWQLPSAERSAREAQLASLAASDGITPYEHGMPAYEASQTPLFYWIVAAAMKPLRFASLLSRVWAMRVLTLLIGSLVIPIGYNLFRAFWSDDRPAFAATLLLVSLPGLMLNVARVSNESLNIVMFTLLAWILVRSAQEPARLKWVVWTGVILGLGLLTKASFLTAIPATIIAVGLVTFKQREKKLATFLKRIAVVLGLAALISGWWYVRNMLQTGTLTGLDEALILRGVSFTAKLHGALTLNWPAGIATILLSHMWYGGWSLIALPHWLYAIGFMVVAAAGAGVCWRLRPGQQHDTKLLILISLYVCFWLGQFYQMLMMYLSKGSSTAMGGWYLYCMVAVEVVLIYEGITALVPSAKSWTLPVLTVAAGILDVAALHAVWLPYFANGSSWADTARLTINKPPFLPPLVLFFLWVVFLARFLVIQAMNIRLGLAVRTRAR